MTQQVQVSFGCHDRMGFRTGQMGQQLDSARSASFFLIDLLLHDPCSGCKIVLTSGVSQTHSDPLQTITQTKYMPSSHATERFPSCQCFRTHAPLPLENKDGINNKLTHLSRSERIEKTCWHENQANPILNTVSTSPASLSSSSFITRVLHSASSPLRNSRLICVHFPPAQLQGSASMDPRQ